MATITARSMGAAATRFLRPKYAVFAAIAAMALVVLHKDRVIADPADPIWDHYRPFAWWLIPHGIAGLVVLLLGASQFSDRLRRRLPRHRLVGRIYVGAVLVLVPIGVLIEAIKYSHGVASLKLLVATSGFGTLLLIATAMGLAMARRHRLAPHRRWMTRSYAIGLVFLTGRTVDHIPLLTRLTSWPSDMLESHHVSDLWMYVALSLAAAQVAIWWQARRPRATPARPR